MVFALPPAEPVKEIGSDIFKYTPNSEHFDISVKVTEFKKLKGKVYACGTCLELRGKKGSNVYPASTMSDLLKMVEDSDKVLVFG